MVDAEEFKQKVLEMVPQDYKIEFLGKNFNQIVNLLSYIKAEKIGFKEGELLKWTGWIYLKNMHKESL